ncbi:hypothetical protein DY000_02007880 [Brassica cretica]|uniref:Uncharacterized protein n=1 Tax=Brassica cretica TaxID=69181 RepID=A0ABQ7C274_BRACR|nr:hypothetical protein DY000_02007880 [Brassica cretica]
MLIRESARLPPLDLAYMGKGCNRSYQNRTALIQSDQPRAGLDMCAPNSSVMDHDRINQPEPRFVQLDRATRTHRLAIVQLIQLTFLVSFFVCLSLSNLTFLTFYLGHGTLALRFAEDVEAVDVNSERDEEEDVNFVSGTAFQNQRSGNQSGQKSGYNQTTDRHHDPATDRQTDSTDDRHDYSNIDRRPPLTYRVRLPKIDVARLNALRNLSQPSNTIAANFSQQPDDAPESMQVDQTSERRTLRRRKENVPKHLRREVNEKEMDSFTKRILRIPLDKPFEEAYVTHRLWMFFRQTKETEHDIHRIFNQAIEKMKQRITLKKKRDPEKFAVPCLMKGIKFHVRLACYREFEAEYEKEYEASIDSRTYTSIDSAIQPMIDNHSRDSIDNSPANETFALPLHCYLSFAVNTQPQTSIDYHYDVTISRQGDYSIGSWADDSHHESFAVDIELPEKRSDEYDEDYHREKIIEYRGLAMDDRGALHTSLADNKATSIDSNTNPSIDAPHTPDSEVQLKDNLAYGYLTPDEFGIFRDREGQARAMDGRILNISKEDIA